MANYELATAYVQIVPSFRGLQAELTKQLGGLDTDSATTTLGQKLANSLSGVGGALASLGTVAAGTIGAIGGSIGALAAQGGITRALNLEQAEHLFNVLGLGWENYKDIVNDAVKGTRFSLDEAAKIAGNLGASGVTAAEDMSEALRGATGLAATFGSNLSEIGMIYQKVAASGKLSAREVMQFSYQGINVNAALQKSLGKTGEEIKDMVSKGQIDFATFSKAMDENFGTAAKSANDTFVGSLANVKAALSRVGAKFATPGLVALRQIFNSLQPLIDAVAAKIEPQEKKF
ncbi:MAG: tape measure protein, partial [Clostridia bacterium]|nr:tape measure protein [Clostridia bacterium]